MSVQLALALVLAVVDNDEVAVDEEFSVVDAAVVASGSTGGIGDHGRCHWWLLFY